MIYRTNQLIKVNSEIKRNTISIWDRIKWYFGIINSELYLKLNKKYKNKNAYDKLIKKYLKDIWKIISKEILMGNCDEPFIIWSTDSNDSDSFYHCTNLVILINRNPQYFCPYSEYFHYPNLYPDKNIDVEKLYFELRDMRGKSHLYLSDIFNLIKSKGFNVYKVKLNYNHTKFYWGTNDSFEILSKKYKNFEVEIL